MSALLSLWSAPLGPADAVLYGKQLLAVENQAASGKRVAAFDQKKKVLVGPGITVQEMPVTVNEQIDILRSAGRWYLYWGVRGHPIHAWW